MNIVDDLMEIVRNHGISLTATDEVFEVDSIQYISIMCDIEEHFSIQIADDDLFTDVLTVNSLVDLVVASSSTGENSVHNSFIREVIS